MHSSNRTLAIGLGTFGRPQMLRQTLVSLAEMEIPSQLEVTLILADNDPDESAKPIFEELASKFKFPTTYLVQPKRGIVHMRNMILEHAIKAKFDLMAFIDDDEEVAKNWLEVMLHNMSKFQADVVVGRVARELPENTPKWVIKGKFFERPSIATGTVRTAASTSNVIFDLNLLCNKMSLRFHPALNLSGSSDTYMFTEATEKGAKIIWVNDDLIKESIPASRMTVNWLLKRAFRHTNCRTLRARLKKPYYQAVASESLYGLLHFGLGIILFPVYIFMGKAGIVHSLRFIWKGAGSFAGLSGYVYKEYEKVHGH